MIAIDDGNLDFIGGDFKFRGLMGGNKYGHVFGFSDTDTPKRVGDQLADSSLVLFQANANSSGVRRFFNKFIPQLFNRVPGDLIRALSIEGLGEPVLEGLRGDEVSHFIDAQGDKS